MICSFCRNFQVFWDCQSIMSWNMALKFAGDTSNMLKKLYSEFQPKKLTWHMCFELKTTEKPPFFEISIIVAGRCWGFGGVILELPPKFKTGGRNSFVVVFVTLSIFFCKNFFGKYDYMHIQKLSFFSTDFSTKIWQFSPTLKRDFRKEFSKNKNA